MTDLNLPAARIALDGLEADPMTSTNRQKATMIETAELPAPPKRRMFKQAPKPAASAPAGPRPDTAGGIKVSGFDAVITYALAAIGLWISYTALADLALRAGLGHWQAAAWPLIVDGLILVATRSVFTFGEHPSKRYAWGLLVTAAAVSIAGNAAHILLPPGPVHPFIALGVGVVPPVMTLAVTHLVMVRARVRREQDAAAAAAPAAHPAAPVAEDWDVARAHNLPETAPFEPVPVSDIDQRDAANVVSVAADVAWPDAHHVADFTQPDPVAQDVADIAQPIAADVAPHEVVAEADAMPPAAPLTPEQTITELLNFINKAPLSENVRATARLKIKDPLETFAAIAAKTGNVAPSTAYRRYLKFEDAAVAAGFSRPPLPDLGENTLAEDIDGEFDEMRELVNN